MRLAPHRHPRTRRWIDRLSHGVSSRSLPLNRTAASSRVINLAVILALSVGVFIADLMLPLGLAITVIYIPITLLSLRSNRPIDALVAALIGTILTVLGATMADDWRFAWTVVANRGLVVFAIWATALVCRHRRRGELEQAWLIHELDHRLRNNLSAVLAVADQTVAGSRTLADFTPAFAGRLRSMAVAHELLARARWHGVPLASLIERVVEPYHRGDPDRFSISGPPLILPADIAPTISMAIHELAAHAVHHGALSAFDGRVVVEWSRELDAHDFAHLRVTWSECPAGPASAEDEAEHAQLDRLVAYQTGGRVESSVTEETRRCDLVIPMETLARRRWPSAAPE